MSYFFGQIKIYEEEYKKFKPTLEEDFECYEFYKNHLFFSLFDYDMNEFEIFLDLLVQNISICELSTVKYISGSRGHTGIYYIYPGRWEYQESIEQFPSDIFKEYMGKYKIVMKTKENLRNLINNKFEI